MRARERRLNCIQCMAADKNVCQKKIMLRARERAEPEFCNTKADEKICRQTKEGTI